MEDEQVRKLQEAQGFTEHAVEQLSAEIAELNRRLGQALTRLARLEQRLERLASGAPGAPADDAAGAPDA